MAEFTSIIGFHTRLPRRAMLALATILLLLAAIVHAQNEPGGVPGIPGLDAGPTLGPPRAKAALIPIALELDDVMASSVRRRVAAAQKDGCELIIFDIDSGSGFLSSAYDITKTIRGTNLPTVAYVRGRALFGAALVTLSCRQVIAAPQAQIGYCPPTDESAAAFLSRPRDQREKLAAPLLADIAESARQTGLSPQGRHLAAAMVIPAEIHEVRNDVTGEVRFVDNQQRGQLLDEEVPNAEGRKIRPWKFVSQISRGSDFLTVAGADAVRMQLAQRTLANPSELPPVANARELVTYDLNFVEKATLFLTQWPVRMFLFVAMLVCIYIELSHPGISVAGIGAVILLALLVGAPYLTGLAQVWEILLIVLGLLIIIADLAIFGGIGFLAVPGFIIMAIGLVATFVPSSAGGGWAPTGSQLAGLQKGASVLIFGTLLALAAFASLSRFLYMAPGFRRLQLADVPASLPNVPRDAADQPAGEAVFVGALGAALSDLRPSGKARFGTHIVDVVSQGQFITAGSAVEVTEAGFLIVVRPAPAPHVPPHDAAGPSGTEHAA